MSLDTQNMLVVGFSQPTFHAEIPQQGSIQVLLDKTNELKRLGTIPQSYFDRIPSSSSAMRAHYLPKYQWVQASLKRDPSDSRPESVVLANEAYDFGEIVPYEDTIQRRAFLETSSAYCASVAEFRVRWERERASLAILQVDEILNIRFRPNTEADRARWDRTKSQLDPDRSFRFSDVDFMVEWRSGDEIFDTPLRQWGLHILWQTMQDVPDRSTKVLTRLKDELNLDTHRVYVFLGAYEGESFRFDVLDTYRPIR